MDCYRRLGEDRLAEVYAHEVIQVATDVDGRERLPMRIAEANVTLGVAAARQGDLEQALSHGRRALRGHRQSLPSLLMVTQDLDDVLRKRYGAESEARDYLDELQALRKAS
jgi:Tfp pilus assembly protein PilF